MTKSLQNFIKAKLMQNFLYTFTWSFKRFDKAFFWQFF